MLALGGGLLTPEALQMQLILNDPSENIFHLLHFNQDESRVYIYVVQEADLKDKKGKAISISGQ